MQVAAGTPIRRILIIDDEQDHAEIIAALLRREGYDVEVAFDADEGLTLARECPPDLVLLDLYMPRLDGFDAARALRADDRTRDVPVVFLSACGEILARARGINLDELDYLPKPFHATDLLAITSELLNR